MLYTHENGISFRKIEERDLKILKELKDEAWPSMHHTVVLNMVNQQDWFERISRSPNDIPLMAYMGTEGPIGFNFIANIDWISRCYDGTHALFPPARGRGLGAKTLKAEIDFAFNVLNMNRRNCEILFTNEASRNNALKAGMVPEGLKRKAIFKNGKWIDSEVWGVIRGESVAIEDIEEVLEL